MSAHSTEVDAARFVPGAPVEGRYVVEVWGADIGPGELLAVISDALIAHETEHERVRVSYTDSVIAPGSSGA